VASQTNKQVVSANWKNPEDYSNLSDLTPKFLAWEFLRRNKEYQEDWYNFSKKYLLKNGNYHVKWWVRGYAKKEQDGGMILSPSDPHLAITADNHLQPKWRIFQLIPPWQIYPLQLAFLEKNENKLSVDIDLTAPLKPQLNKIGVIAKRHQDFWGIQKTKSKIHKDNLPDYLRIFDAVESGLKKGEIAATIYPKENNDDPHYRITKRLDEYYKRACKFINGDYIKIVMPQNW